MLDHLAATARDARQHAGLRQIDIATTAGVGHVTVSRFERGETWTEDPDGLVQAYATELGVDPRVLWGRALRAWREEG